VFGKKSFASLAINKLHITANQLTNYSSSSSSSLGATTSIL
jgi:hypothetical protein